MSEEAASGSSKLDSLSKEDLIKLIKKYIILQKQLKTKNEELTNKLNENNEHAPLANATSTDDLLEQEKFKEFQVKINELNKTNVELVNENINLKNTIDNLNGDLEKQEKLIRELEAFKNELQPQLDSARREIELNKSMLDMLNNEIQLLNSEKLDLEKRLLSPRRNNTPSVIIEEDESDLVEEEKQMSARMLDDVVGGGGGGGKSRSMRSRKRHGVKSHRRKANGAALERIVENEEEEQNDDAEQSEPSDDGEETSGSDNSREDKTDDAPNSATTHKKDMTFYVDELKSELEAEREKSNEYQAEIRSLQQRLENVDQQETLLTASIKAENDRLQKELVDALLRIKESEKPVLTESPIESSSAADEPTTTTNVPNENNATERVELDLTKLRTLLETIKEDLLAIESSTAFNLERINKLTNDDDPLVGDQSVKDFVESLRVKLAKSLENHERECERVKYIENQMAKAVQDFKQEISSLENKLDDNQKEYINFKLQSDNKIKSLQADLEHETKRCSEIKSHQEKFEKEASKSKLLDLEMADYEKTVKSLNVQVISKDKEIGNLKQEIAGLNEKIGKLKADVDSAEREKDSLNESNTQLKQELVKVKKDIRDSKDQVAQLSSQDSTLKTQLETINLEIDSYKLKLAEMTAERQRLNDRSQSMNEAHQRAVEILETRIKLSEEEASEARSQLSALKVEYENYKVKVQHAFKKQKEQSESTQQETNQSNLQKVLLELDQAKGVISKLNTKIDELNEKIKLMDKENELMQDEYARALDRNTKLLTELKHKESDFKQQLEEATKNNSTQSQETVELVKNLKLENEALSLNYKEKIKQLNMQSCQTIDMLQAQLQESKDEIDRLCKQLSTTNLKASNDGSDLASLLTISTQQTGIASPLYSPGTKSTSGEELAVKNHILRSSIERQQGEGVDRELLQANKSISPDHAANKSTNNISLEELLSEPSKPTANPNSQFSVDSKAYLSQIEQLKSELNKGRLQLEHLNELLNESELNNARLTDQINLLKEEIRRLERNQEREKSISNMEYLKNVVLRFLTFSTAQEKAQLLPVLSTMLKLSQEEQNAIMAKGAGSSPGQADAVAGGWSSYLPKW